MTFKKSTYVFNFSLVNFKLVWIFSTFITYEMISRIYLNQTKYFVVSVPRKSFSTLSVIFHCNVVQTLFFIEIFGMLTKYSHSSWVLSYKFNVSETFNFSKKFLVSFTYDLSEFMTGWGWWSKNLDIFSVEMQQLDTA